jgi:hypothetical protein
MLPSADTSVNATQPPRSRICAGLVEQLALIHPTDFPSYGDNGFVSTGFHKPVSLPSKPLTSLIVGER